MKTKTNERNIAKVRTNYKKTKETRKFEKKDIFGKNPEKKIENRHGFS